LTIIVEFFKFSTEKGGKRRDKKLNKEGFYYASTTGVLPLSKEDTWRVFCAENPDLTEELEELKKILRLLEEKKKEIQQKVKVVIFREKVEIIERGDRFLVANLSEIESRSSRVPVVYLNLQECIESLKLDKKKLAALFVKSIGFLEVYQRVWKTPDFQRFLRRLSREGLEKKVRRAIKNDLADLGAFLWVREKLEDEKPLSKIISDGLEIRKEVTRRIFQRLQEAKKKNKLLLILKEVLVDLILLQKEAEIIRDQRLSEKIRKAIDQITGRGKRKPFKELLERVKAIFNQAEKEMRKTLLLADLTYYLPEEMRLEQRKRVFIKVLEKKGATEFVSQVKKIKSDTEWEKTVSEVSQKIKISPKEIEEAEKIFRK